MDIYKINIRKYFTFEPLLNEQYTHKELLFQLHAMLAIGLKSKVTKYIIDYKPVYNNIYHKPNLLFLFLTIKNIYLSISFCKQENSLHEKAKIINNL